MGILLVCYVIGAVYLFFELVFFRNAKEPFTKLFLIALIWPLSIPFLGDLVEYQEPERRPGEGETFAPWERKAPKGNYNEMAFGAEKEDAEDMAGFIKSLESRPDAPLPDALTFNYQPTGISKTYPKGTMFPSALVRDWKRGFYMGKEAPDSES